MEFKINHSITADIRRHLKDVDKTFVPSLSSYINIDEYSEKIFKKSNRFEIWENKMLQGLIAVYYNDLDDSVFATNVSISPKLQGQGWAKKLFDFLEHNLKKDNKKGIRLEVKKVNKIAISFYENLGFEIFSESIETLKLHKK